MTQGLCRSLKEFYREPVKMARLWVHETERVFRDRMVNEADMSKFDEFRVATTRKFFDDCGECHATAGCEMTSRCVTFLFFFLPRTVRGGQRGPDGAGSTCSD